jgi:hypothetical protein
MYRTLKIKICIPVRSVVNPDPDHIKIRIRIRINVMRIYNTVSQYINFSKNVLKIY